MMAYSAATKRILKILAYVISAVVLLVVIMMRSVKIDTDIDFSFLPGIYSVLNAISGGVMILAYYFIRKGNRLLHQRCMTIAISLSFLFLIGYVLYHITTPETKFCQTGLIRLLYFILLISHVVLAAVSFPFVLFTYLRGLIGEFEKHKRMARIVFPIWLYVCLSGPVCYMLLYPCYPK